MDVTAARSEATLLCESDSDGVATFRLAGGTGAAFSARCPGKESPNEDAAGCFAVEDDAVLAVADGMGGARGGEKASQTTMQVLADSLQSARDVSLSLRAAILNGIERANQSVIELALGAATTLAVVEIQGRIVRPYHVGDSMILVVGQRGKIKLQTVSHSPVGFAVESGLLDETEATHHEHRHLVSNVLGAVDMRIEIGSALKLASRDTLLLASDGLFDNLHVEEVVEFIRKGPLDRGVVRLAEEARRRMLGTTPGVPSKPDDLSILAWRPSANTDQNQAD